MSLIDYSLTTSAIRLSVFSEINVNNGCILLYAGVTLVPCTSFLRNQGSWLFHSSTSAQGHQAWCDVISFADVTSHMVPSGPRSAVGNVSGYRCVSDCRSKGREFDPGPVPYFRGDWSWNNFYGHSPPFRWFIQEGLLSVTSESMYTNYWLTACSSLPRKKCD